MRSPYEKISLLQSNYGLSIEYTFDSDERLNSFDNGMMTRNNIKGILGYIYEASGGQCKLRFDQPKGMQLSLLLERTLRKQVLLGIFINIAQTFHRAEEFMLNEASFLLDPQLVFVNTSTLEAELLYIPTGITSGCPYWQFIKNIMYSGIVSTDEDTSYVQQLVNYINSNHPAATDKLCDFLVSLNNSSSPAAYGTAAPGTQPRFQNPVMQAQPAALSAQPVQRPSSENRPAPPPHTVGNMPIPSASDHPEEKQKKGGLFSGLKNKKKAEKPPKQEAVSENGFGFSIPGQKPTSQEAPAQTPNSGFGFNVPGHNAVQQSAVVKPPAPVPEKQPVYAAPASAQPVIEEAQDEPADDGRTVLLNNDDDGGGERGCVIFLEDKHGKHIPINKTMFFIGKGTNTDIPNDLVVKNNAVSRNHAYLQPTPNGATITDNNSSNGTFINGERIPSLIKRELKNGDVVLLADEKFIFRVQ